MIVSENYSLMTTFLQLQTEKKENKGGSSPYPFFSKAILQPKLSIANRRDAFEEGAHVKDEKVMPMELRSTQNTFFIKEYITFDLVEFI